MRTGSTEQVGRPRPPTILDVAREAGVSRATAARALNGSPNVSPKVSVVIRSAAERLGYRVNIAARTLRTTKTALVGLLVPVISNEVFGEIAERLDESLRVGGVSLTIASSGWSVDGELSALDAFVARSVDVLAAALADDRDPRVSERLRRLEVPLVLLDREVRGVRVDAVVTDQRPGITECLQHLAALGHRTVGLTTGTDRTLPSRGHLAAFSRAVARLGLDKSNDLVARSDEYTTDGGRQAAQRLVALGATAIVACAPISFIAGVLDCLQELELKVPDDISLVAYTDSPLARVYRPHLSVIARDVSQVGRLAGRFALDRMVDPELPARVEVIPTQFIDRQSTTAPKRRRGAVTKRRGVTVPPGRRLNGDATPT